MRCYAFFLVFTIKIIVSIIFLISFLDTYRILTGNSLLKCVSDRCNAHNLRSICAVNSDNPTMIYTSDCNRVNVFCKLHYNFNLLSTGLALLIAGGVQYSDAPAYIPLEGADYGLGTLIAGGVILTLGLLFIG